MKKNAQQVKIEQPLPETNEVIADESSVVPALDALEQLNKMVVRDHDLLKKVSEGTLTEEEKQMFMVDENINYEDVAKTIKNITKSLNNLFIENV